MTKSWMWYDDNYNGTMGAIINIDKRRVSWFFEAACACTDSQAEQSLDDFLANGSNFVNPPDDVLAEIHETLTNLMEI